MRPPVAVGAQRQEVVAVGQQLAHAPASVVDLGAWSATKANRIGVHDFAAKLGILSDLGSAFMGVTFHFQSFVLRVNG